MPTIFDVTQVSPGHYAQKQLLSPSGLVRWSHGSRFRLARELVAPFAGRRLLDYGCGDGTFLSLVLDLFPNAVGADVAADQLADCSHRFSSAPGVRFLLTDALDGPGHAIHYDVVVCMEVLEHCPDDIQLAVLDRIGRVTIPGGRVIVSVPIEIGPTLVAKQTARALVALTGASDYAARERYQSAELLRQCFASSATTIRREEYRGEDGARFTGHKGFNWRRLEHRIAERFEIERRLFSPVPYTGAWLNSQVWFVCRTRPRT